MATVEDVVILDGRGRKQSQGTKIRSDILTTDPQTNFPIFGAMGFEVTQALVIGKNTLLVEGPSDILYLQAASSVLKKLGRVFLNPAWALPIRWYRQGLALCSPVLWEQAQCDSPYGFRAGSKAQTRRSSQIGVA
jgi:hypothetical protein